MSVKGCNWALNVRGVSPARKALLFALGERHNRDTDTCYPRQEMLADDAGMSLRSVQTHLAWLERAGLIAREVRSPTGRGAVTFYRLAFDRTEPVEADPDAEVAGGSEDQPADSGETDPQLSAGAKNPKEPESSVPDGTGEDADLFGDKPPSPSKPVASATPDDPDPYNQLIWTAGLKLLLDAKQREGPARAFLGRLIKQARGDTALVANAITACSQARAGDPAAWLAAAVRKRLPGTVEHRAASAADRAQALEDHFAAFARGERWKTHWGPAPDDPAADYPAQLYARHGVRPWEAHNA